MSNTIVIDSLQFHNPPHTPTVPLRRNEDDEESLIEPPEWRRGEKPGAVAFRLTDFQRTPPVMRVVFRRTGDISGHETATAVGRSKRLLGDVSLVADFPPGSSLATADTALDTGGVTGVSAADCEWDWTVNGTAAGATALRIYFVLATPGKPWGEAPDLRPWTTVLEKACEWAANARSFEQAQTDITKALNALGDKQELRYDGDSFFTTAGVDAGIRFKCAELLESLSDSHPTLLNCEDFSMTVAALSNALGCKLERRRLDPTPAAKRLKLENVRPTGGGFRPRQTFIFHEVAVFLQPSPRQTLVWDGSLRAYLLPGIDEKLVPAGIGMENYVQRLFGASAQPRPKKALVYLPRLGAMDPVDDLEILAANRNVIYVIGRQFDLFSIDGLFGGDNAKPSCGRVGKGTYGGSHFQLTTESELTVAGARKHFSGKSSALGTSPAKPDPRFEQALVTRDGRNVLFRRGNLVCRLSVDSENHSAVNLALRLDDAIVQAARMGQPATAELLADLPQPPRQRSARVPVKVVFIPRGSKLKLTNGEWSASKMEGIRISTGERFRAAVAAD